MLDRTGAIHRRVATFSVATYSSCVTRTLESESGMMNMRWEKILPEKALRKRKSSVAPVLSVNRATKAAAIPEGDVESLCSAAIGRAIGAIRDSAIAAPALFVAVGAAVRSLAASGELFANWPAVCTASGDALTAEHEAPIAERHTVVTMPGATKEGLDTYGRLLQLWPKWWARCRAARITGP